MHRASFVAFQEGVHQGARWVTEGEDLKAVPISVKIVSMREFIKLVEVHKASSEE